MDESTEMSQEEWESVRLNITAAESAFEGAISCHPFSAQAYNSAHTGRVMVADESGFIKWWVGAVRDDDGA